MKHCIKGVTGIEKKPHLVELFVAAFGKKALKQATVVEENIAKLHAGTLRAEAATYWQYTEGEIASTLWVEQPDKSWAAGNVIFGPKFHGMEDLEEGGPDSLKRLSNLGRAGTIIHEASHQLCLTGDKVSMQGKIIDPLDATSEPAEDKTGCKSSPTFSVKHSHRRRLLLTS